MRAFVRSPFVSALAGGAVVAVVLLVVGRGGGGSTTTTVLQTAPAGAASSASAQREAPTPREIYDRDAPGVVYVRAATGARASASASNSSLSEGGQSSGTGFVIDADGHILTSHHVVADARSVRVELNDHESAMARVVGEDAANDLALLQIDPAGVSLHPLTLGDSATAHVGDSVLAIGNPFGLEHTLTTGVVSALDRELTAPNGFTIQSVIQTDAPINPGNSGGPLIDASGRVIGITTQVAGGSGIAFAVPIDTAKRTLSELKRTGHVTHSYLGIRGMTIDARLAGMEPRTRHGVLVQTVYPGSPAANAGVRGGDVQSQVDGVSLQLGGDVITSVGGRTLDSMDQLSSLIARCDPGDKLKLGVLRNDMAMQLTVTVGKAPKQLPADTAAASPGP
ncbi:MAG TPA: trypsin-like peptidase domain-containing protein [Conexibacter sp.]|jgi:S1-C subfamily serine protease